MTAVSNRTAILAFLTLWGACTGYLAATGADWTFPIVSLVLFGGGFSALNLWLTRRWTPPETPVANPRWEGVGLLAYLVLYAVVLVGWGLGAVKEAIPAGPAQELAVLAYKLAIHVGLPALVVIGLGGAVRPLFTGVTGTPQRWWIALLLLCTLFAILLAVVSPSLAEIGTLGLAPAVAVAAALASWAWISVEAGVCEEFLFRALIQTRLSAWLRSPAAAICLTSVVFALSHWPGLYLRGGPGTDGWSTDPLQVAAFTIATLAPLSLMLGVLWERTRSLLLVVLVHGAIDALPNTAGFVRVWF